MRLIILIIGIAGLAGTTGQVRADSRSEPNQAAAKCPPFFLKLPPLGAENPQALAERFWTAFVRGDKAGIYSCYDLRSAESLAAATVYAELANVSGLSLKCGRRIRQKFGQKGIDLLEQQTGVSVKASAGEDLKERADEWLAKLETVEEGSLARVPDLLNKNSWLRLRKLERRWYAMPPEHIGKAGAMVQITAEAVFMAELARKLEQVARASENSNSLDEFHNKLMEITSKSGKSTDR